MRPFDFAQGRLVIQFFGLLTCGAILTAQNVEQTAMGRRPPATIAAQFDGLGFGFAGPQGTATLRNPYCTKGHGIMSHLFKEYAAYKGDIPTRNNGVLVAMEGGISTAYSLETIQERGRLFIGAQAEIYEGMIIGENARPDDMPVNPCRAKKLSNMRSTGDGKGVSLSPPLTMTLERSIEYIAPDEYVEVTPKSLRLRKKVLNAGMRKRSEAKVG